jgi:hypothetical protein
MDSAVHTANYVTPHNRLPVVITGPGDYIRRDGARVTIREVDAEAAAKLDVTAYAAKGSAWRMFRGKIRLRGYDVFHVSGRANAFHEGESDIIGPWPDVA